MSQLSIAWRDGPAWSFNEVEGITSARMLGFEFEVQPVYPGRGLPPTGYNAFRRCSSMLYSDVIALELADQASAYAAVESWLASEIDRVRPSGLLQLLREVTTGPSKAVLTEGLGYALKFADAVIPLLGPDARVEVSPCSTDEGLSGLYFENMRTGQGVKVMRCTRPGLIVMFWGTREELESPWQREPSYFTVEEIPHYADVAAKAYLT